MSKKHKQKRFAVGDDIANLPITNSQITSGVLDFIKGKSKTTSIVRSPVKYG